MTPPSAPDLHRVRPPPGTATLNLALGAVCLSAIPAAFLLVDRHPWAAAATLLPMVFVFTALFILAHEAIHGTLIPGWPRAGDALGRVFALAYALLDYGRLKTNHWKHHREVGTPGDPDGDPSGSWPRHLGRFLLRYLRVPQLVGLVLCGHLLGQAGHTRAMLLAYVLPIACSTLVVFTLGIWLVHHPRLHQRGLADARHRAVAIELSRVGSLLAILNFNYHWLHHEHPQLTWVQLGRYRAQEPRRLGPLEALRGVAEDLPLLQPAPERAGEGVARNP